MNHTTAKDSMALNRLVAAVLLLLVSAGPLFAQAAPLAPNPRMQFFDANGDPLDSGTLETYTAGTLTPKATYSDVTLQTANPTTIDLNSAGRPEVSGTQVGLYLATGCYKFILKDSTGSSVWTADNICGQAVSPTVLSKSASYAVTPNDGTDILINADATSGAFTITLYTAVANTGKRITVKKADATGSQVTVDGNGTETLDGALFIALNVQQDVLVLESDGVNWKVLARPPTFPLVALGRLTATTATPVTTGDVSAATSIFYTPYTGNQIALYDGAGKWELYTFSEITISLVGCTASRPYDIFIYNNAGTISAELLVWTNATTRATALATQNGVYVKTGATARRYVGSVYCNATGGQTDDTLAKRYLWNMDHRVARAMQVRDATNTWTHTAGSWHQVNAAATNQLDIMVGVAEDAIDIGVVGLASNDGAGTPFLAVAVGADSTSSPSGIYPAAQHPATANRFTALTGRLTTTPAVGRHFYAWLEYSDNSATTTFYGDNGGTIVQTGITGLWKN